LYKMNAHFFTSCTALSTEWRCDGKYTVQTDVDTVDYIVVE